MNAEQQEIIGGLGRVEEVQQGIERILRPEEEVEERDEEISTTGERIMTKERGKRQEY